MTTGSDDHRQTDGDRGSDDSMASHADCASDGGGAIGGVGDGASAVGPDQQLVDPAPQIDHGARVLAGSVSLLFATVMHLMIGGFVVLSGRVAPTWAVLTLVAVWLVVAALIWRWHRRRPLATLLLPFVAAAVLWGALTLGQRSLDWGA